MTNIRHPRINCCIFGCKRGTTKWPIGSEIICGKCWRLVSKSTKRWYRKIHREVERVRALDEQPRDHITPKEWREWDRAHRMGARIWLRAKREANHRSMGI
jgi:hypothetical protein